MKAIWIRTLIILFCFAGITVEAKGKAPDVFADAKDLSKKNRTIIKKRYGRYLRGVARYSDLLVTKYLKNYTVYQINVFNPASYIAGRAIKPYSCAAGKTNLIFFENSPDVVNFLSVNVKRDEITGQTAMDLACLYARLRRIDMIQSKEDYKKRFNIKDLTEKEKEIEPPLVEKEGDTYRVAFYAMLDPNIHSFGKVMINVSREEIKAKEDYIDSRGGYD